MAGQILLSDFTARGRPVTTWGHIKLSSMMLSSLLSSTVASSMLSSTVADSKLLYGGELHALYRAGSTLSSTGADTTTTPQYVSTIAIKISTASISFTYYARLNS